MTPSQGLPTGLIPAVEAQWSHSEFVDAVVPDTVVLKINHARRLLKRGEDAASYFPAGTDVITTTTISDEQLALISWDTEYEIVEQFAPDYHIPADESVYLIDDPDQRTENIIECMHGTLSIARRFDENDVETEVIPLIKGLSPVERAMCYETLDDNSAGITGEYVAYYATQYYTGGQGARTGELVSDINAIAEEYDPSILLLGALAPSALERMPTNVIAASGQNAWRKRTTPRTQSPAEIREVFADLTADVEAALATEPSEDESGVESGSGSADGARDEGEVATTTDGEEAAVSGGE